MKIKHLLISFSLGLMLALALLRLLGGGSAPTAGASPESPSQLPAYTLEIVEQVGGDLRRLAVQGNYAYLGVGARMFIYDISNPTQPVEVGRTDILNAVSDALDVDGSHAYLIAGDGLHVFSIADPTNPTEIGTLPAGSGGTSIHAVGDYVYWLKYSTLRVISVADTAHPTETGSVDINYSNDVFVSGDTAYVAGSPSGSYDSGLVTISVADKANPAEVGFLQTTGMAEGVHVVGDKAYVASTFGFFMMEGYLSVISVADPANPAMLNTHLLGVMDAGQSWASGVRVVGDTAYVSAHYGGMAILSVADPANITELGSVNTMGRAYDVRVAGDYAYIADSGGGMRIISTSDKNNPVEVGAANPGGGIGIGLALHVADGYAYIASGYDGFSVISVADPEHPVVVATEPLSGGYDYAKDIYVAGDYAYMADLLTGFKLYSVSDKSNPILLGACSLDGVGARSVFATGDLAYLAISDRTSPDPDANPSSLRIISTSDKNNPTEIANYTTIDDAYDVWANADYAYLAYDPEAFLTPGGIDVISVADPANPVQAGYYSDTLIAPRGIYVQDETAYLASANWGLWTFSLADPVNPTLVGNDWEASAKAVDVQGDFAFLASGGVRAVSLITPTQPISVAAYNLPGKTYDVQVEGEYVYAANSDMGLVILRFAPLEVEATPAAITWMAAAGGDSPPSRAIQVESTGRALSWTAEISPAVGWFNAVPLTGSTPAAITVSPQISGLVTGTYTTQLMIISPDTGTSQTIPIRLILVDKLYELFLPLITDDFIN